VSLLPGTRLGSIEVLGLIGAGGMGEVYRGHDTRLGREVAVKSLPDSFARDGERRARFEREAQVLASLNHPNIAALHDLREHEGSTYLLLELVDGETLAERIDVAARTGAGLPITDALDIARQIAEALDAAHARGVVHRDLKPANIKLTGDGVVKVLDFGLAKVAEPALASDSSHSPTLSIMLSAAGVILGTAPYMSPEQARGRVVDKRADIWSFGCILFELLAGRPAFPAGETTSDTLAAVLTRDPDWSALPPRTPPPVRRLIERCLRKDPRSRLRDIGDAHSDIVDALREPESTAVSGSRMPSRRREFVLAALVLLLAALSGWLAWNRSSTPTAVGDSVRFDLFSAAPMVDAGNSGSAASAPYPALSPDGRSLAYVATTQGKSQLWLHRFSTGESRSLPGTEGVLFPFWSPRGDAIAFFADSQLKRFNLSDESVQVIASRLLATTNPGSSIAGGTWGANDVLLLGQAAGPLLRVSARGSMPEPASTLDQASRESGHRLPEFLPDGRHYTYFATSADTQVVGAYVGTIDSTERHPLPGILGPSLYSPRGQLLFIRESNLWAQPFDLTRLELSGEPVQIAPNVGIHRSIGPFSVSRSGTIAYRSVGAMTESRLAWFDRSGREIGTAAPDGAYRNIDLSPDNRFVAFQAGAPDVWVLDLQRGVVSRVTTEGGSFPFWSRDGKDVFFLAARGGVLGNYRRTVGAASREQLVVKGAAYVNGDLGAGRYTYTTTADGGFDVWLASAESAPTRLTETRFSETYTTASPNSAAIAYAIDETGRWEVVIQSIASGQRTQVSNLGGLLPKWSNDGRELFYLAPDATLMAVPVKWGGQVPDVGAPVPLFQTRLLGGGNYVPGLSRQYDVASDGRFLMQIPSAGERSAPITVIFNWNGR
jgi:serine/threonine protein kinase